MRTYHVRPAKGGGWEVRREGAARASRRSPSKGEAAKAARQIAGPGDRVVLHRRDGSIPPGRRGAAPRGTAKPDREAVPIRLLVETDRRGAGAQRALERSVNGVLAEDATGRAWTVRPMFPALGASSRAQDLSRFFEVRGSVIASPTYPIQQVAFDIAYRLRDAGPPIAGAQPDLPSSAFAAPPPDSTADTAGLGLTGPPTHLPESTPKTWALDAMHCREAWELVPDAGGSSKGAGILVGHPDTGYSDHPELGGGALDLTRDRDILQDDDVALDPLQKRWWWPLDTPGHGTGTSSVIVSRVADEITGVIPEGRLVPIRTVKSVVQVFDGDVARAIDYARQIGCHVISMSLGGVGFFPGLTAVIQRAVQEGVIVMAAAGNYVGFVTAPASLPGCIAVAATNARSLPWRWSSHGPEVDVSAPGESVWAASAALNDGSFVYTIERHTGTSFAAAHLAGVAGLWLAHHGRDALIRRYGKARLQAAFLHLVRTNGSWQPPNWDPANYGVGIVDARTLLQAELPDPAQIPPDAALAAAVPDPLERITRLVPEMDRAAVRRRLGEVLATPSGGVSRKLDRYGAELAYLLAEDKAFREEFLGRPARVGLSVAADTRAAPPARRALLRSASRSLAREVLKA
jgi:subtilisin family serine protease